MENGEEPAFVFEIREHIAPQKWAKPLGESTSKQRLRARNVFPDPFITLPYRFLSSMQTTTLFATSLAVLIVAFALFFTIANLGPLTVGTVRGFVFA